MVEKYYNDKGEVGILISEGYGAGWYTWNDTREDVDELVFDKGLIELVLNNASTEDREKYIHNKWKGDVCDLGVAELEVEFIPKGTKFIVEEYDGFESISLLDNIRWLEA